MSAASTPTAETHKNKKPPEASVVSGTTTTAFAHKPPAVPGSGRPLPQPSGSALRKSSSLAKKGGSEKSDGAGIFALAGLDIFGTSSATQTRGDSRRTTAADGDDDGSVPNSRKVKFRDEGGDPSGAGEGARRRAGVHGGVRPDADQAQPARRRQDLREARAVPRRRRRAGISWIGRDGHRHRHRRAPSGGAGAASRRRALGDPPEELTLGARIGAGSFGEVFTADWLGTEVAMKQMHDKNMTGESIEEFAGEVRMMQSMRHPNVVLFLGAVVRGPSLNIVCELMPYGSLHALLHGATRNGVELSTNGRLREQMARDCARGHVLPALAVAAGGALRPETRQLAGGRQLDREGERLRHVAPEALLEAGLESPSGARRSGCAPEALRNDPTDESAACTASP